MRRRLCEVAFGGWGRDVVDVVGSTGARHQEDVGIG